MFTKLILSSVLGLAAVAGLSHASAPEGSVGAPTCCAKNAYCCRTREACCPKSAAQSDDVKSSPTCCEKHAYCCTIRAACCPR